MNDYIEKENDYVKLHEAINSVGEAIADGKSWYDALCSLPSCGAPPIKRGKWSLVGADKRGRGGVFLCSACDRCYPFKCDFCPNCGAYMGK